MFEFEFMWLTCLIAEKIVECRSKSELRVERKKKERKKVTNQMRMNFEVNSEVVNG